MGKQTCARNRKRISSKISDNAVYKHFRVIQRSTEAYDISHDRLSYQIFTNDSLYWITIIDGYIYVSMKLYKGGYRISERGGGGGGPGNC